MKINDKYLYEKYSFVKTCQMIFVDSNIINELIKDANFYSIAFLKGFLSVIETHIESNAIDDNMRNNILNYINAVRQIKIIGEAKESRNERINLINDILTTVNRYNDINPISFYQSELYKRYNNHVFYKMSTNELLQYKNILYDCIKYDRYVLFAFSKNTKDEDFNDKFLPILIENDDDKYCATINCFICEAPEIFLNKNFYERCMLVFEKRMERYNDKQENKCITLQKRFINKFVKKYSKK